MSTVAPWPPGHCPYVTPEQLTGHGRRACSGPRCRRRRAATPGAELRGARHALPAGHRPRRPDRQHPAPLGHDHRGTGRPQLPGHRPVRQRQRPVRRLPLAGHAGHRDVQVSPNATWPRSWTVLPGRVRTSPSSRRRVVRCVGPVGGRRRPVDPVRARLPGQLRRLGQPVHPAAALPGQRHLPVRLAAHLPHRRRERSATRTSPWTTAPAGSSPARNGAPIGAAGVIYDALGGGQESIAVTAASVTSGPGTLTLSSPLNYAHGAGIAVSAMPETRHLGDGAARRRRRPWPAARPRRRSRPPAAGSRWACTRWKRKRGRCCHTFRRTI